MHLRLAVILHAVMVTLALGEVGAGPRIRLESDGPAPAVIVEGLDSQALGRLAELVTDPERLSEALSVRLKGADGPSMLGRCLLGDNRLRFEPRFPLVPGLTYHATLRLEGRTPIGQDLSLPKAPRGPATRVIRVMPTGEELPENLLKFYVYFSAPMARGEAYTHVQILDQDEKPLSLPFLELGEELWDPGGTRLTLLLDPGRIKRGLVPREQEGPILVAGRTYTLRIRRDWPDASGNSLFDEFRKRFIATAADEISPTLASWKLDPPRVGTHDALTIRFPEPLDDALLRSALRVVSADGHPVEGVIEVDRGEKRWLFSPTNVWKSGLCQVVVEAILEDRSGNNLLHPFEVDVTRPATALGAAQSFRLPFQAAEKAR
jgi:hypothetical protein